MNKKIINSILVRKFNSFVESIKEQNVADAVRNNTVITGGCIASMLLKEKVNDFDIYFRDKQTTRLVAEYYVDKFKKIHKGTEKVSKFSVYDDPKDCDRIRIMIKSAGVVGENTNQNQYQYFEGRPLEEGDEYIRRSLEENLEGADELDGEKIDDENKKEKFRPVFMTDNAITLSDKVQIIIRFYGEPEKIHENYDFVHCTNYWTSWDKQVVLKKDALESLLTRQLQYVGSKYPVCSMIRTRKFIKNNWHINAGQFLKIAMQISELDLNNVDVLEDQLTGVDTAYFLQMIQWIREKQQAEENFNLNMPYIVSLIDKLF